MHNCYFWDCSPQSRCHEVYIKSFISSFLVFMKRKTFTKLPDTRTVVDMGFSHFVRSELGMQIVSFGAKLKKKYVLQLLLMIRMLTTSRVTRKITHLVTSNSRARTTKVKQAAQRGNIKIVNQQWLVDSMSRWERQNENDYLVSF